MNHLSIPDSRTHFRFARLAVAQALSALAAISVAATGCARADAAPPKVGEKAVAVTWGALGGGRVSLKELTVKGPVVLVVLRGFPGYQCPVCTMQVGSLIAAADQFATARAQVVLVYPGPAERLKEHATEFVSGKQIPKNFRIVLDPDYAFTNRYGLRWDAKGETAYPSTFVIEKGGAVVFAKVSKSHGGRSTAPEILKALTQ
jgi:peroxiredoxin